MSTVRSATAVEVHGLGMDYGSHTVLDEIDLEVASGSIVALLGPNGAGKTTLVRILSTLVRPVRGTARVAGFDVAEQAVEVRRRIALTGQDAAVDELLTGREFLVMMGRLRRLGQRQAAYRAGELIARFDLADAADRRIRTYSGGTRRRLDLAASLVIEPAVLFLDEPTTGLDPRSRQAVWDEVRRLADDGVSVLLTTQYLEEADRLADRVAVLHDGRIVAHATGAELKASVAGHRLDLVLRDHATFSRARAVLGNGVSADAALRSLAVETDASGTHVHAVLHELVDRRIDVASLSVASASLDDVFLALTDGSAARRESTHA
jgi:ABC-2 type transport system ATP-binding protein